MTLLLKTTFASLMLLAGFLLFQVQPMMAKYILPWFGGSASTWTVCMLFFQFALLAGYAYVYAVSAPLTIRRQAVVQILLLLAAIAFLPITPSDSLKPPDADNPIGRIAALLLGSVGATYVVLSTTSPLLQRWLVVADKTAHASRYFALSNLGSFVGLLSYPFFFERFWSSAEQTQWWSKAFIAYAVLGIVVAGATITRISPQEKSEDARGAAPPEKESALKVAGWIFYSALGSVLLLATTNQISQWTAVVPFLWILPLSLYLATFIIAFGHQSHYDRLWFFVAFACLTPIAFVLTAPESSLSFLLQIGLQSLTMFAGCMICHSEMVRLQPSSRRLPRFYMMTAFGGALGGAVVTLLAPLAFKDYYEHPLALALTGASAIFLLLRGEKGARRAVGAAFSCLFAASFVYTAYHLVKDDHGVVESVRNFYGVVKVVREDEDDPAKSMLTMVQAGVQQGSQYLAPERRREPYCAFSTISGIGRALENVKKRREGKGGSPDVPLRIGSIGLGVGVLAALGKTGDVIRIYELNPAVTELANRNFSFLRDSLAKVEISHGDGRILLERELAAGSQQFDILVVDAFRGASPPIHLMTAEAFDIYLKHLAPNGVLAVNFELDTLDVAPLHRGLAEKFNLGVRWFETPTEGEDCDGAVSWALYTRDAGFFAAPGVAPGVSPWRDRRDTRLVWTDANANLFSVINWDRIGSFSNE